MWQNKGELFAPSPSMTSNVLKVSCQGHKECHFLSFWPRSQWKNEEPRTAATDTTANPKSSPDGAQTPKKKSASTAQTALRSACAHERRMSKCCGNSVSQQVLDDFKKYPFSSTKKFQPEKRDLSVSIPYCIPNIFHHFHLSTFKPFHRENFTILIDLSGLEPPTSDRRSVSTLVEFSAMGGWKMLTGFMTTPVIVCC